MIDKEKFEAFATEEARGFKARLQTFMGEGVGYALVIVDERAAPEVRACLSTNIGLVDLLGVIMRCYPGSKEFVP